MNKAQRDVTYLIKIVNLVILPSCRIARSYRLCPSWHRKICPAEKDTWLGRNSLRAVCFFLWPRTKSIATAHRASCADSRTPNPIWANHKES